jgi:hypothetical protein
MDLRIKELLNVLAAGQFKLVFRDEESIRQVGERVFDQRVVFARAQKQADRRIVALGHHVPLEPAHVGVELPKMLKRVF